MAAALDPDTSRIDTGTLISAVWLRMGRIFLVTIGLMALTFVVLMFVPKMYESSASILVEQRDSSFLRASNETSASSSSVSDDMAIASQVELIQSRDTLLSVIDSVNLRAEAEFNTADTGIIGLFAAFLGPPPKRDITEIVLTNVTKRLTVIQERDSRIISILFRSENPVLAARIANAIADAHVNRRAGLVIEDTADASKWLETEIDKLRQKVAEADAKVANFRIDNDLYSGQDGNSSLIDQQLSDIATQITQSQERQSTATSRAKVLKSLIQAGKPIDSVPALQNSATIAKLAEQKSNLQSEKAELTARLLPNHPSLVALTAQIAEINAQMVDEGKRIADALEAEAEIEEKIEASLRDQLTRLKQTASGDLTNGVTLAELEREAKAQRDLLETYLVRYRDASARTDVSSALPDVRVVTAAAPSAQPASPKTMLILIAVAVVAIAGQVGQILFGELVAGRAIIEDENAPAFVDTTDARSDRIDNDARSDRTDNDARSDRIDTDALSDHIDTDALRDYVDTDPRRDLNSQLAPETDTVEKEPSLVETESAAPPPDWVMQATSFPHPVIPTAEPPQDWAHQLASGLTVPGENALPPEDWACQLSSGQSVPSSEHAEPHEHSVDEVRPAQKPSAAARHARYMPRSARAAPVHAAETPRLLSLPSALQPLVDAMVGGREHIVLVAGLGDPAYAAGVFEQMVAACGRANIGVATIDAASERLSANPGLSDLLVGAASFGDVVHADHAGQLARVPWGRQDVLDTQSSHGVTLAEALSDIYNVVLIAVGDPGLEANLKVFAGMEGYLVIANTTQIENHAYAQLEADAETLGFSRLQIVSKNDDEVQVA